MSDAIYYVYEHRTNAGELFYVGKGKGNRYKSRSSRNRYWGFVAAKHGFNPKIIKDGMTEQEAYDLETVIIDFAMFYKFPMLTNFVHGGKGGSGLKLSKETIEKRSKSATGKKRSNIARKNISEACMGRKVSEETKIKLSEINKGKTHSDYTKEKIRISNTGKKRSEDIIEKFSMLQKKRYKDGYQVSEETREKMRQSRLKNVGNPISEETRKKLSLATKGKKRSKETIAKMIEARKNTTYIVSDETRVKMSISAKNRIKANKHVIN